MIAAPTSPLPHDAAPNRAAPAVETGPRVAYQGEPGAFGDAAISSHWNGTGVAIGLPTFAEVVASLIAGDVDAALLPVWNSSIGTIAQAQGLVDEHTDRIEIVDEVVTPIRHALLALPGASVDSLRAVGSHPAALGQCTRLFADHPRIVAHEAFDTAGAARELAALVGAAPRGSTPPWYAGIAGASPETLGAIASTAAAARHGLVVLATDLQDRADNHTRFVVVRTRGGARW
ncbi:MAG: hypothetical protein JO180_11235 [Gemmatirosa sp.]|nr:hypothetical protein [Gemmatirosa sp.]